MKFLLMKRILTKLLLVMTMKLKTEYDEKHVICHDVRKTNFGSGTQNAGSLLLLMSLQCHRLLCDGTHILIPLNFRYNLASFSPKLLIYWI
jgi:hypothetical protein